MTRNFSAKNGECTDIHRIAPEYWLELGVVQFRNSEYADAIKSSLEALRLRPGYAAAYNNICAAENAGGSYRAAAAACQRALTLQPNYALARNNLTFALSKSGGQ